MSELDVSHISFNYRGGDYRVIKVRGRNREIEVTVSPTGRSVHVHVDGKPWRALEALHQPDE